MAIEPFGFDRVFRFASADAEEKSGSEDLGEQFAALEAQVERMREEHAAELTRARADGFEAGLSQARHERDAALLAATDALHAGLDDVVRRFDEVTDQVAREAGSVALLAAEMLAGHAVALEPARAIDEALARALDQVARGTRITVRVHPTLCDLVETMVVARREGERRSLSIQVIGDLAVPPSDARIGWVEGGLGVNAAARRAAVLAELAGLLSADDAKLDVDGDAPVDRDENAEILMEIIEASADTVALKSDEPASNKGAGADAAGLNAAA